MCVFVCMATKAIHLEAVSELSTLAFLATFRRFAGRRGVCSHIYSDCGTNFVGASKKLKVELHEWTVCINDEFKNTLANYNLTFEELSTVLCQIEGCLNSRPLCGMTDDPNDLDFLTPGHFLTGDAILAVPEHDYINENITRLTRWKLLQRLHQDFWKTWNTEYLARLQQRPKWKTQTKNLESGNMVLLKDEQLPPARWLLGRVTETHPGKDGLVRVVSIKTKNSIIKRPVSKICLLPIDNSEMPAVVKPGVEIIKNRQNEVELKNNNYGRNKTKCMAFVSVCLQFIALMNLMVGISATSFMNKNIKVTPLDTKAEIFFEDIGKVNLLSNTWQLILYYDLNNFWEEQQMYNNCLERLEKNCETERTGHTYGEPQKQGILSETYKNNCMAIHYQLKEMVEEIFRRNELLYHGNHHHLILLEIYNTRYLVCWMKILRRNMSKIFNQFTVIKNICMRC